jgi:dipeptidyl aminopeptidase/acylaminoacyl peptidase
MRAALLGSVTVLALAAAGPAPGAEARHAITHADVWLMKRIGAPALSPDGRFAAFSVTEPAYDRKDQLAHLWLVPTDASQEPRRLTDGKGPETGVTWCADNHHLAFSAKREGDTEPQIYVLDLAAGGEALRITNVVLGATGPAFAPDCTRIAFVADVWPGAKDDADNRRLAKERAERKYQARVFEGFPVRYWDRWLDERRPHLFVQALEPGAAARDLLAGTRLAAAPGYSGGMTDEGTTLDHAWTADGAGLVLAASIDRDRAARDFTSTQLWYVPAAGGEAVRLTTGRDSWGDPRFAPDGRTLLAGHVPRSIHSYSAARIAAFDFAAGAAADGATSADPLADSTAAVAARYGIRIGAPQDRTLAVDRAADAFGVAADGTLYYLADDRGLTRLYLVPPGGAAREAGARDAGAYSALAVAPHAAQPVLVARWESTVNPPEIVRLDPSGTRTLLTHFNTERAAAIDWLPVEHFTIKSKRGRDIHSFLVKPPAFDPAKKYPLLVMMHGGPAVMNRDAFGIRWNYHLLAAPGYVLVTSDYSGSPGYGERFAQAIDGDPLAGPAEEINAAADAAIRRYPFIDGSRQCAAGASYGGHLANWMQASTTRYKCLISHAGLVNLEAQWGTSDTVYHREVMIGGPPWQHSPLWRAQSPIQYAAKFRTPVLVSIGERDFRVPLNNSLEYWTALQRQQVPSRLVVWPEENHWILRGEDSRYFYEEVARWLATYLAPGN